MPEEPVRIGLFLDHHGVLDKNFGESSHLVGELQTEFEDQLKVYCLSYAPPDWRVAEVTRSANYSRVQPEITGNKFGPFGKRVRLQTVLERDGLIGGFFVDDQAEIVRDVRNLSPRFKVEAEVLGPRDSIRTLLSRIRQFLSESLNAEHEKRENESLEVWVREQ